MKTFLLDRALVFVWAAVGLWVMTNNQISPSFSWTVSTNDHLLIVVLSVAFTLVGTLRSGGFVSFTFRRPRWRFGLAVLLRAGLALLMVVPEEVAVRQVSVSLLTAAFTFAGANGTLAAVVAALVSVVIFTLLHASHYRSHLVMGIVYIFVAFVFGFTAAVSIHFSHNFGVSVGTLVQLTFRKSRRSGLLKAPSA